MKFTKPGMQSTAHLEIRNFGEKIRILSHSVVAGTDEM
jgi:hypothetical protein